MPMDLRREFDDWYEETEGRSDNQGKLSAFTFLMVVVLTTGIGLMMLYSASYNEALIHGLVHHYFFSRQLVFGALALVGALIIRFIPIRLLKSLSYPLLLVSIILLLITLFTPFGQERLGSRRWLQIGPLPSLQPSEIAKIGIIFFYAFYNDKDRSEESMLRRFGPPVAVSLLVTVLIFLQRDYSSALLFLALSFALLLTSGFRLKHLLILLSFVALPGVVAMLSQSYRVKRVFSFLFPALDPAGLSYQVSTSLKAIKAGGLFGVGLGNGVYKLGLLPEVQSDFIFASVCEEIGLVGAVFILVLLIMFAILGYNTAQRMRDRDRFLSICTFGLTSMILFQTILNLAVVTGLLPPTGIPMPFFSQGGTNLLVVLCGCAVMYRTMLIASGRTPLLKSTLKRQERQQFEFPGEGFEP